MKKMAIYTIKQKIGVYIFENVVLFNKNLYDIGLLFCM